MARNWALISNPQQFESLIRSIASREFPGFYLFGRLGKDYGQDLRSQDNTEVIQVKFHTNPTFSKVLSDADLEYDKIVKYLSSTENARVLWQDVEVWSLFTNFDMNPENQLRWDQEIVSKFSTIGISAKFVGKAQLNAWLDGLPELERYYFEGESIAFIGIPEAEHRLSREELFLNRAMLSTFIGREAEFAELHKFLESERYFFFISGPGGVGKTRLMFQFGRLLLDFNEWNLLWLNSYTLSASPGWLDSISAKKSSLVFIDDIQDENLLYMLYEQASTLEAREITLKIIVTLGADSPSDMNFLKTPKFNKFLGHLLLKPLNDSDGAQLCSDLLKTGRYSSASQEWLLETSKVIVKLLGTNPVWLVLAIHLLEETGDLNQIPKTANDLADRYIRGILKNFTESDRKNAENILRGIALSRFVNRDDSASIARLQNIVGGVSPRLIQELIDKLIQAHGIVERGRRRANLSIKPDVIRDFLLADWLLVKDRANNQEYILSQDASDWVKGILDGIIQGELGNFQLDLIEALVRLDIIFTNAKFKVSLIEPLLSNLLEHLSQLRTASLSVLTSLLNRVAAAEPARTTEIIKNLRIGSATLQDRESNSEDKRLLNLDLLENLAESLYLAGVSPRLSSVNEQIFVLEEFIEFIGIEVQKPGFDINSHRQANKAQDFLRRTLGGALYYHRGYFEASTFVFESLTNRLEPDADDVVILHTARIVLPILAAIEFRFDFFDGRQFQLNQMRIGPEQQQWKHREKMVGLLKAAIKRTRGSEKVQGVLWTAFATLTSDAKRAILNSRYETDGSSIDKVILRDLDWTLAELRQEGRSLSVLKNARELWVWHLRHDKDPEIKKIAAQLENIFLGNELAAEFTNTLNYLDYDSRESNLRKKAEQLASEHNERAIELFIDRGLKYYEDEQKADVLFPIAGQLGYLAEKFSSILSFANNHLQNATYDFYAKFAATIMCSYILSLRERSQISTIENFVEQLAKSNFNEEASVAIIRSIYHPPRAINALTSYSMQEIAKLRSLRAIFERQDRLVDLIYVCAWGINFDWLGLRRFLDELFISLKNTEKKQGFRALLDSIHWIITAKINGESFDLPRDFSTWILDKLLDIPDLGGFGDGITWHMEKLFEAFGKPDIVWLYKSIKMRLGKSRTGELNTFDALPFHHRISEYVIPVNEENKGSPAQYEAIRGLLELSLEKSFNTYYMPDYIHDIDPIGIVVPEIVVELISSMKKSRDPFYVAMAKVIGRYSIRSKPWKLMAASLLEAARRTGKNEQSEIYFYLRESGMKSWSAPVGSIPEIFITELDDARAFLSEESDSIFHEFANWNYERAQAQYDARADEISEEQLE